MNVSFFLSPGGDLWLEEPITIDVQAGYPLEDGQEVNILYWDNGKMNLLMGHGSSVIGFCFLMKHIPYLRISLKLFDNMTISWGGKVKNGHL